MKEPIKQDNPLVVNKWKKTSLEEHGISCEKKRLAFFSEVEDSVLSKRFCFSYKRKKNYIFFLLNFLSNQKTLVVRSVEQKYLIKWPLKTVHTTS